VLADRVAVGKYSPQAFEEGLTYVIRRQVEFEDITYWEITNANRVRRSVQNLYELKASEEKKIEEKIKEAINRPTNEDDTHPSPVERFRFVRCVTCNNELAPSGMVWNLFTSSRQAVSALCSFCLTKKVDFGNVCYVMRSR